MFWIRVIALKSMYNGNTYYEGEKIFDTSLEE